MIERLAALPRRLHGDPQALHRGALADVLVETLRPELALDLRLLGQGHATRDPRLVRDVGGLGAHAPVRPR